MAQGSLLHRRRSAFALTARPVARGHELSQGALGCCARILQTKLAAPPEHVVDRLRPFVAHQIAHLRRRQVVAESAARDPQASLRRAKSVSHGCRRRRQSLRMACRTRKANRACTRSANTAKLSSAEVAARQWRRGGHAGRGVKIRAEPVHRLFGKTAIGRELAAIELSNGARPEVRIERQHVVAREVLRLAAAVVIKRANAGECPHHIARRNRLPKIAVGGVTEIVDVLRTGASASRSPEKSLSVVPISVKSRCNGMAKTMRRSTF